MKAKKHNYGYGGKMSYGQGGKMSYGDQSSREIVVMAPSLDEAIAQMKAAMSKSTEAPSHFKVKACYYEGEED